MRRAVSRALVAVLVFAVLALVVASLAEARSATIAAKTLASSTFLAIALAAGASRHRYGRVILAGLLCSWLGDLLLLGSGQRWFLTGLASFLIAHVAYVTAFVSLGLDRRWLLAGSVPVAAVSLAASAWFTPHLPADMLLPVRVYTVVISVMLVAALGARGRGASALIPLGAVLFYLSDLSVAAGQFVHTDFPNYVWGLPFYYAGQALLAFSIQGTGSTPAQRQPEATR